MPGRLPIAILVALAACCWLLVLVILGTTADIGFFKPFAVVVGFLSLGLAAFDRWGWRWPGIRRITGRPIVEGTYRGEIRTEWASPASGEPPEPVAAALVIRQTFTAMTVTVFTAESTSESLTASLDEAADGRFSVVGLYRNEPRLSVQDRSRVHHGGLRLQVAGAAKDRLQGSYWTDRRSQGELELHWVSEKRASDFVEAEGMTAETAS